jgi:hypothetical protein
MVPFLFGALVSPASAAGAVKYSDLRTEQERVAYLYGIIAQLQMQLNAIQSNRPAVVNPVNYPNNGVSISGLYTDSVSVEDRDSAELSARVSFKKDATVKVWFEYGTNYSLSYSTQADEIKGDSGDTENISLIASDLDNNTVYYYRPVVEDKNGSYIEGTIKSFKFVSSNSTNNDNNNNSNDNDEWSLEINDDEYETGESIRVEYTIPEDDEDDKNWIGLFEIGSSDKNYIAYKYIDDTEGYVTFRVNDEDEYEFRMFSNDTFNQEAESDEFEVTD